MTLGLKKTLRSGKLPMRLLDRLLRRYATKGRGVVVGASIGVDAAVIDLKAGYLIAKTDPITFLSDDIGFYAIHINANDIAVMGGAPRWFLATVLFPEGRADERVAEKVFSRMSRTCSSIGVSLCGGHTEITPAVTKTVIVGNMLGVVEKKKLVTAAGAKVGDDLILTKGIAIEGTSIIAREKGKELLKKSLSPRYIARCKAFAKRPGISVLPDAKIALSSGRIHAMHDPTEGGLATGLHELSIASGKGVTVEKDLIPVYPETRRLCAAFGLDPMGVIASGSLLASIDPEDTGKVLRALRKAQIPACRIGSITGKREGVRITEGGRTRRLKIFESDELTRIF